MKTTIESTASDDVAIRLLLPSALAARVLAYEDELQQLRAQQPTMPDTDTAKIEAMKARALHAGAYRNMRLEAAIGDLVHDHRPQLSMDLWKSRRSRAEWAQKQIKGGYIPGWRTIDIYLKTLSL